MALQEPVIAVSMLSLLGFLSAIILARRILDLAGLLDSGSLRLAGWSFSAYALALLLEGLGELASGLMGIPGPLRGSRPAEVAMLLLNRGAMLASPIYIAAYALYVASLHEEYVDLGRERLAAHVPLLVQVYIDYNVVSMALLLIASILAYARRGLGTRWLGFYGIILLGHLCSALSLWLGGASLLAGMALRALAPMVFLASLRQRVWGRHND